MTSRRILITKEYLNARFFSVFLFVWALDLSLGYSVANFLVPQILVHEDALVNGRVFIFTSTTSVMTSRRILITDEYLNAHFFSVFLFVWALQVLKELIFSCKFS